MNSSEYILLSKIKIWGIAVVLIESPIFQIGKETMRL